MKKFSSYALLAFATAASSLSWSLHERREDSDESQWALDAPLGANEVISFSMYLTQPNIEDGEAHLMDVADPRSCQYGKHWSHEDVRKAFQPGQGAIEDVQSWLNVSGISGDQLQASLYQGKLAFTATATQASSLFQSNFSRYHHTQSDSYAIGCEAYSIPSHLVQHIDFVTPTIGHEPPSARAAVPSRPSKSRRQVGVRQARAATAYSNFSTCYEAAFPGCISTLYNITPFTGNPRADNMMGIFNTLELGLNESYSQADLDAFFTTFAPSIRNGTHPSHASVDGGVVEVQNPMYEGSEAMLDYSIALPIIYPQEIKAFVTNDGYTPSDSSNYPKNTGIQSFLDAIDADICRSNGAQKHASLDCGKYKPTNVISISYGAFEYTIGKKYAKRVCNEFMKLGLQGVTVLLPAGDYNVGPEYSCGGENLNVFIPEWLATCPWVTTVGGTEIPYETDILNKTQPSEIGWHVTPTFGGGGGFSNYYKMPAYQKKAVEGYLDTANLSFASYSQFANASGYVDLGAGTNGIFNRAGRAYPDVSALANEIALFVRGKQTVLSGTSAATPLWGAIITRINEERLAAGKSTVGFINPVLYKNADAMTDIIGGENDGCDFQGFPAVKGWDAFTGLGSPKFDKLLEVFMALP